MSDLPTYDAMTLAELEASPSLGSGPLGTLVHEDLGMSVRVWFERTSRTVSVQHTDDGGRSWSTSGTYHAENSEEDES